MNLEINLMKSYNGNEANLILRPLNLDATAVSSMLTGDQIVEFYNSYGWKKLNDMSEETGIGIEKLKIATRKTPEDSILITGNGQRFYLCKPEEVLRRVSDKAQKIDRDTKLERLAAKLRTNFAKLPGKGYIRMEELNNVIYYKNVESFVAQTGKRKNLKNLPTSKLTLTGLDGKETEYFNREVYEILTSRQNTVIKRPEKIQIQGIEGMLKEMQSYAPMPESKLLTREQEVEYSNKYQTVAKALDKTYHEIGLDRKSLQNLEKILDPNYHRYLRTETGTFELASLDKKKEKLESFCKLKNFYASIILRHNQRLINLIVSKFLKLGVERLDLVQEGNIGLMKAWDKFDPGKGFRLATYASSYITKEIMAYILNNKDTIRVPIPIRQEVRRINKAVKELFSIDADIDQKLLEGYTGMSSHKIKNVLDAATQTQCISMETPFTPDSNTTLKDVFADEKATPEEDALTYSTKQSVKRLLKRLSPRERKILTERFGIDEDESTLEEIGRRHGLSRERIRQIERKALARLRITRLLPEFEADLKD